MFQGLRASIAPVSGSSSVTTESADAPRDGPSTHSTYAVTESRRDRPDVLRIVSREILIGSSSGTYWRRSSAIPCAVCSNRL